MNVPPKIRMNAEEFLAWGETQSEGRFELVEGEVVVMAPERARHNLTKLAVARTLQDAVAAAGLRCTVFTDGIGIRTGEDSIREPDATVQWGDEFDPGSMLADRPVIVVEVVSPSSERDDTGRKFVEYFSIESVHHYVVIDPWKNFVLHHQRGESNKILTTILRSGELEFNPPGFAVSIGHLLGSH